VETLAQHHLPYLEMVKGLIAKKTDSASAAEHFRKAYEAQSKYRNNEHAQGILALMSALHGLALVEEGKTDMAEKIVHQHWGILKNSPDQKLLEELKLNFPALRNS
jgi:hypothetical protein